MVGRGTTDHGECVSIFRVLLWEAMRWEALRLAQTVPACGRRRRAQHPGHAALHAPIVGQDEGSEPPRRLRPALAKLGPRGRDCGAAPHKLDRHVGGGLRRATR